MRPGPLRIPRGPKDQVGFTLVEVLVALLIMSVIATMAWRGLDGILKTREGAQGSTEKILRLQSVIAQWEADFNALVDTRIIEPLAFNGAMLRLTRHQPEGIQLVVWAKHGPHWQRWASPITTRESELNDYWMRSQQLLGNERGQMKALDGVSQWRLYYFRNNTWTNAMSSSGNDGQAQEVNVPAPNSVGNTTVNATLPMGVRLELVFTDASGWAGTLVRDIRLPAQPTR